MTIVIEDLSLATTLFIVSTKEERSLNTSSTSLAVTMWCRMSRRRQASMAAPNVAGSSQSGSPVIVTAVSEKGGSRSEVRSSSFRKATLSRPPDSPRSSWSPAAIVPAEATDLTKVSSTYSGKAEASNCSLRTSSLPRSSKMTDFV
jgi:hypothetical protein